MYLLFWDRWPAAPDSHVTPELYRLHSDKEPFIDLLLYLSHSYPTCTVAVSVSVGPLSGS